MQDDICVAEHQQKQASLSKSDVASLRKLFASKVDVSPTDELGNYILQAHSYVGFVVLPSGRKIRIEPKVPIDTVFALLAAVYDPSKDFFHQQAQSYTSIESLFEFVVRIFAAEVEDLIARGILRGYRSVTEDLNTVRGRILIAETIHAHPALRDKHWCSFSQFTPNILENRIIHWVSYCLQGYTYKEASLTGRLYRIGQVLAGVELDSNARTLFDKLEFHRLNDAYQPSLAMARILLDHMTFSGANGQEPFLAYMIDMNWLFEKYLGVVIQQYSKRWGIRIVEQERHPLDLDQQFTIKPDVIIYRKNIPVLILDAKYKMAESEADLYQMLTYCHTLFVQKAILVHPVSEHVPNGRVLFRGPGNIQVKYLALDLSGGPKELDEQGKLLGEQVKKLL